MPLNDVRFPKEWPPLSLEVAQAFSEWSALYSGDPNQLLKHYGSVVRSMPGHKSSMWAQELVEERKTMLHLPVASDIAVKSAELLFSEAPRIYLDGAEESQANARLIELVDQGGVNARALEAAEVCAAMGGVYLKPAWDEDVAGVPLLTIAQADCALPEFVHGILKAVTFWRVVDHDERRVIRHLERYEVSGGVGVVENGLFVGTWERLGERVDLTYHSETAGLDEGFESAFKGLLATYVPNMRPNKKWRGSALGISDYNGVEGFMDALDETYTSLMRDLRLGKANLLIPEMFLKRDRNGNLIFDGNQELFLTLDVDPVTAGKSNVIQPMQPNIRVDEHIKTCVELLTRTVTTAGYSPGTFGLMGEAAPTATEVKSRERASFTTRAKKERYWRPALEHMMHVLSTLDAEVFQGGSDPNLRPKVELADSVQPDVMSVASSVEVLARAQAISAKEKVRMVHPEWNEKQINAEVQAILKETGLAVPNPDDDPAQAGLA